MAKKPIFLFAVLAVVSLTFAQEQKAISFGVRAGLNLGKIEFGRNYSRSDEDGTRSRTSDETNSTGNLIGFHVGAVVDIGINEFFYIQPGVLLTSKGGETNSEYKSRSGTSYEKDENKMTIAPYYIDIPIMLSLKGKLNDNLALKAQAGPYIGFGLFGKMENEYKEEYNGDIDSEKSKVKDVFSPTDAEKKEGGFEGFNRFNAGIGFGGGIEFNGLYLGLSYNYGLTNLYKEKDSSELYERTLGITLGYNF
jgi:hypothetical protein